MCSHYSEYTVSRAPGENPGRPGGWEVPQELFKKGETQPRPGLVTRISDPRRPSLYWGHYSKCPLLIYGPPGGTGVCCGVNAHTSSWGQCGGDGSQLVSRWALWKGYLGNSDTPARNWLVSEGLWL